MSIKFAVTGMERSGTMWLSLVLDGDPAVKVYHEPPALRAWDTKVMGFAHDGHLDAKAFVRARYNYWMYSHPRPDDRAEVNSLIRYVAGAIAQVWKIPVAGLVRDGRKTVRSLYARGLFQEPGRPLVRPPAEIADDPFAACCWYWADAYERLSDEGIPVWRLESLNENWDQFGLLCDYLGVEVPRDAWTWLSGQPANVGILDEGPPAWPEEQVAAFTRWAGHVQARYAYDEARA